MNINRFLFTLTFIIRFGVEAQNTFPSSGSVGIGTTSPGTLLHVTGVTTTQGIRIPGLYTFGQSQSALEMEVPTSLYNAIRAYNGSQLLGTIHFFDDTWGGGSQSSGAINLAPLTAMTIGPWDAPVAYFRSSDGKVGIGTSAPAERLEVSGNVSVGSSASTAEVGFGAKLNLLGASENTDVLWLSRYNNGYNNAELRVNIGDDNGGDDAFNVGNIYHADSQWKTFFKVLNNGKVGIGTGVGNVTSDAALTVALENTNGWSGNLKALKLISPDNGYSLAINTYVVAGGNVGYHFSPNGNTGMVVTTPGNVGIGTTSPDAKLSVKGQIHAQEVKVDLNGAIAPDYVFNKDYKLPSLEEIQSYITANKHLPEVPSAKEMEEKGINVGEMNLLLLKKVEELTLQLIELNQKVKNIEKKDADERDANANR
jgi:hypothetical protein